MSSILRLAVIVVCLFVAIGCYVFGVPADSIVFLVAGVIFEAMFWLGIFGKWKK